MGKKDIIKVECSVDMLDLDILGFIDHNITVNIIRNGEITEKKDLHLPKQVVNVIKCKNPRCITSIEQELDQVFILADPEKETYRRKYCEEKYRGKEKQIRIKYCKAFLIGAPFYKKIQSRRTKNCPWKLYFSHSHCLNCFQRIKNRSEIAAVSVQFIPVNQHACIHQFISVSLQNFLRFTSRSS